MIRLESTLLLGIIALAVLLPSAHSQRQRTNQQRQASNICNSVQDQLVPNCCNGFLECTAAGSVGTFMRCPAGTLFDDSLGICNVITDENNRCHPTRARQNGLFCFQNTNNNRQNNNRQNNNRQNNNNNARRRAQFINNNNNELTNPPWPSTTNQNNRFTNQNNRFTNQNRFLNRNPNRFNRNQNTQNRFNRNQNTQNTLNRSQNNNNRFTTNNNRTPTNSNRFTTSNNNNRGVFQAPAQVQLIIRNTNPTLRNNCNSFEEELNRVVGRLANSMLDTRTIPILNVRCDVQTTRG